MMDNINHRISLSHQQSYSFVASRTTVVNRAEDASSEHLAKTKTDINVTISEQGQEQLNSEKQKLGQQLSLQLQEMQDDDDSVTDKNTDPYDKIIAQIKEQIKQIKQELAKLEGDDSEAAEKQKEALTVQLLELNSQLLVALDEKLKKAKQG